MKTLQLCFLLLGASSLFGSSIYVNTVNDTGNTYQYSANGYSALGDQILLGGTDRFAVEATTQFFNLLPTAGLFDATLSLYEVGILPDVLGEMSQENLAPQVWDAVNDICMLTRALSGETHAPQNPKVCEFCATANDSALESCTACGAALPSDLPRACPKCARRHTSEALFCQACGTRLVNG